MLDQIAEKYGLSKAGILIMLALAVAIPLALLLPSPNAKPKPMRIGTKGAAEAAAGAGAPSPAAPAPAAPAPAAPAAPVVAAVAAVPAPTPGRIRREDPFASILPKATPTVAPVAIGRGGGPGMAPQAFDFPGAPLPDSSFAQYRTPDFMPVVEPTFMLAGIYMSSSGQTVAIINDVKVGVGDSVGETGYKVDSIDSRDMKHVTLKNVEGRSVRLDFGRVSPSELVPAPAGRQVPADSGGNP